MNISLGWRKLGFRSPPPKKNHSQPNLPHRFVRTKWDNLYSLELFSPHRNGDAHAVNVGFAALRLEFSLLAPYSGKHVFALVIRICVM